MAITENSFTAEELKGVLTAKPELLTAVKGVLSNDFKHIVQDETEHTQFLARHESEVAGKLTEKWATNVETDLKEITGIPRVNGDEKWHAYMKRVAATIKKERDEREEELTRLKANGNPSAADKARIKELEEGITKEKNDSKTLKETYEQKIRELTVGAKIEATLGKIRAQYRKDYDPAVIETMEAVAKADLLKRAQIGDDGKTTYLGDDGKVITDPATLLPKGEESILMERLKPLIDTGRQQQGGGSGPGTQGSGGTGPNGLPVVDTLPEGVKSKRELRAHLLKLGYLDGQNEFINTMNKLGKAHNLPV